jgi:hypothetical protein
MILQTVWNECVRFGRHINIQVSYKILWLEVQKKASILHKLPCFQDGLFWGNFGHNMAIDVKGLINEWGWLSNYALHSLVVDKPHHGPWWGGINKIQGIGRFDSIVSLNLQLNSGNHTFWKRNYISGLWCWNRSPKNVMWIVRWLDKNIYSLRLKISD